MSVFPCGICYGSNGIGYGLTFPHCLILMMKKNDNKRQCDQLFMCDVLRKGWRLVESLLMWLHVCVVLKCAMLWKWSFPHYLCELVICIILTYWLSQVLCALKKNEYLTGYTISRDVSRAAMDTIFWGTYRAPRWLLYRGSCRAPRQIHWQICPPWVPDWETAGVYH